MNLNTRARILLCLGAFGILAVLLFMLGGRSPKMTAAQAAVSSANNPPLTTTAPVNATNAGGIVQAMAQAPDPEEPTEFSRWQFATRWGKENDPRLAAFAGWAENYAKASAPERLALEAEGIDLAAKRRPVFKALIESNPKLALASTVPAGIRQELPASVLNQLETRISGQGDLRLLGTTPTENGNETGAAYYRRAVINGETYSAHVYGDRKNQQTISDISLHGVAIDRELALSDSPLRIIEDGETIPDKPIASNSCPISKKAAAPVGSKKTPGAVAAESGTQIHWLCHGGHILAASTLVSEEENASNIAASQYRTLGQRKVLFMMVDFSDAPGGAVRLDVGTQRMNDVANFIQTNSYNQINFATRSITPIMRMPRSSTFYSVDSFTGEYDLLDDARTASRANGFNPDNYDFDVVVFADIGFLWGGLGFVGAKGAWVQGAFPAGTAAHELGHNLGLYHANAWIAPNIIGFNGFHEEYGNIFDVMGRSSNFPNNHYNANGKFQLNWLTSPYIHTVAAAGSATYRIFAHDTTASLNSARKYAIRIPVGIPISGNSEDYWLDFRQLFAPRFPNTANGAIVQWGNDIGDDGADRLLDMNPLTDTEEDSPLVVGNTFTDGGNGISFTTVAKGGAGADAYLDIQVTRTNLPPLTLAAALDTTAIIWTTGAPPWIGQRANSHDGVDAAQSGLTPDNGQSTLSTDVNGPGTANFWWSVSSEETFDFLRFFVDGVEIAKITGEYPWEFKSIDVGPGVHHLEWRYTKDEFSSEGADRGWVDQFDFQSGTRPPQITYQPLSLTAVTGQNAEFRVEATGTDPLSFQWRKGGVNLSAATNRTLTLTNVQIADSGLYSVRITNAYGSTISSNATLAVVQGISLGDALDLPGVTWTTYGDSQWIGQAAINEDGVDAAQSGTIANYGSTYLETTVVGPGTLSFYWKVSSEQDYDFLIFGLDYNAVDAISGEVGWTQKTISLTAGLHTLTWFYGKDGSFAEGSDRGWVDNVRFTGIGNQKPIIALQPQPLTVVQGGAAQFTVAAGGTTPLYYYWYRESTLLTSAPKFFGLGSPNLTITPIDLPDAGNYSVVVSNAYGTATSSLAKLTVTSAGALANALDLVQTWTSGGDAPWDLTTVATHDGVDAARSGAIGNNKESWVESTFVGPGTISFWTKVSTESGFDFLDVAIDGSSVSSFSGELNWTNVLVNITSGSHRVRWTYRRDSAGSGGSDTVWLDQVSFAAGAALGDAVDLPGQIWQTGGNANWLSISDVTFDGIDAARSGAITNKQESWIQSTFTGPGIVSFKWKVSSEPTFDTLSVSVDGAKSSSISGSTAWLNGSATIEAGPHVVRWTYAKDDSDFGGADRGWLDQISFEKRFDLNLAIEAPGLLFTNLGPAAWFGVGTPTHDGVDAAQSGAITDSQQSKLQASVIGPGSVSFWWKVSSEQNFDTLQFQLDGQSLEKISGEQNWTRRVFTIPSGPHTIAWAYVKDGAYRAGADAGWIDEVIFSGNVDLAQALDTTGINWTTGGANPWVGQTAINHDATDSGASGTITHSQESWMQATFTGPAQINFWWKVSSEQNGDYLSVRIDNGESVARISGAVDWTLQSVTVPAGAHVVRWSYAKDASVSAGEDRAWVDQISTSAVTVTAPAFGIVTVAAGSLNVVLQPLTVGAKVALDRSSDLTNWTAISTNSALLPTMTIQRPLGTNNEFLRTRIVP